MKVDSSVFINTKAQTEVELKETFLLSLFKEVSFNSNNKLSINDILNYDNIFIEEKVYSLETFKLEEMKATGLYFGNNVLSEKKEKEIIELYRNKISNLLINLDKIFIYTLQVE